jgi:MFS family permease
MLGPFSVDAYLPAFPRIQETLHATPLEVQQTLTAYMLAFAGMSLWHGALSDAFGRRNVVLVGLIVFAVGTLGCAAAHSVHYLWVFRIMQGISAGAGVVVGRAIIRDLYSDAPAARLLSMVTMIFSIAPAIAPVLGGWIVTLLDWRAIFLGLLVFSLRLWWVLLAAPAGNHAGGKAPALQSALPGAELLGHLQLGAVPDEVGGGGAELRRHVPVHRRRAGAAAGAPAPGAVGPIRLAVHAGGGRHLPRRAGRQPPGRQDALRAPDRHRLRFMLTAVRQRAVPLLAAAGAAVDGAADVLL